MEVKEVAKACPVCLAAFLDVPIAGQQADGRVAVEMKLRAVVKTKPWDVSQRCPRVFCIIEMCSIWRTFLGSKRNGVCGCVQTSGRSQGTFMEAN